MIFIVAFPFYIKGIATSLPPILLSFITIHQLLLLLLLFFQEIYGRFGKRPNKLLIESYEHFVLESCENLKASQLLKVTVSRCIQYELID